LLVFISWLKLNCANQLIFYADDVNILGEGVLTMGLQRKTEALVVASKETSLKVTAEKSKYMTVYGGQNAGTIIVQRLIIVHLKRWNSSSIGEEPKRIKIPFRNI
jgi:hypothetical protein